MGDPISPTKLSKLFDHIKSNPKLARKLDLFIESVSDENRSKRKDISPIKLKKVKFQKISDEDLVSQPSTSGSKVGSPAEIALEETSKGGANHGNSDDESESQLESDYQSEDSQDEFDCLENFLMEDDEESDHDSNPSDEDEEDLKVLGGPEAASWSISKKSLKFYLKAADIELKKDLVDSIKEEFKADQDTESHFAPPRFSSSLWSTVQSSKADTFKLKCLYKVQEHMYLSLKPLLACLDSADKDSKIKLTKSIQLICTSNLLLNRFRRSTIAPHLKPELRKQILALPISHDSFFGEDFSKATDSLVKEQSTLEKVFAKKPLSQRLGNSSNNSYNNNNNYNNNRNPQKKTFFRGGNFSGNQKKGNNNKGKKNKPYYQGGNKDRSYSGGNSKENSSASAGGSNSQ